MHRSRAQTTKSPENLNVYKSFKGTRDFFGINIGDKTLTDTKAIKARSASRLRSLFDVILGKKEGCIEIFWNF